MISRNEIQLGAQKKLDHLSSSSLYDLKVLTEIHVGYTYRKTPLYLNT